MEDYNLYLPLRSMSHTIYPVKFERTIIHHHVHLQRESQSHEPAHLLMRLYQLITAHDDDFHYAMKHEKNVQQFQPIIFSQFDFLLNESNKYILGFLLYPI
jgi:hypothetical protein